MQAARAFLSPCRPPPTIQEWVCGADFVPTLLHRCPALILPVRKAENIWRLCIAKAPRAQIGLHQLFVAFANPTRQQHDPPRRAFPYRAAGEIAAGHKKFLRRRSRSAAPLKS